MSELGDTILRPMQWLLEAILHPLQLLSAPDERLYWATLLGSVVFALIWWSLQRNSHNRLLETILPSAHRKNPSIWMDLRFVVARGFLRVGVWVPAILGGYTLSLFFVRLFRHVIPFENPINGLVDVPYALPLLYTGVLFVCWDASRYLVHRLMHKVPALWEFHQVHHSATALTPLTLYRVHPVESFLMDVRGAFVTASVTALFFVIFGSQLTQYEILGSNALAWMFNFMGGNLRHSHIPIGFGSLEKWILSPKQHQIHHSIAREHHDSNYGTWIALWDRLGKSWIPSHAADDLEFGVQNPNHDPHSVRSALLSPIAVVLRTLAVPRYRWAILALVLIGGFAFRAQAQTTAETDPNPLLEEDIPVLDLDVPTLSLDAPQDRNDDPEYDAETRDWAVLEALSILGTRDSLSRVAGSAHVIGQKKLEEEELNDVHEVLAAVPGVYVRDEEGFGLRPNIGLRGADSDRSKKITLLEDGVLFAPAPYAAPAAYYSPIVTRMVNVEVFKGAAIVEHGPHTVAGAVNYATRQVPGPRSVDAGLDVSLGRFDTHKAHGYAGAATDNVGGMIEFVRYSSAGFKELTVQGDERDTGFEKYEFMGKLRFNNSIAAQDFHRLEYKFGYAQEDGSETYLGLSQEDFDANPFLRYPASELDEFEWERFHHSLNHYWNHKGTFDLYTTAYRSDFNRTWFRFNGFQNGPKPQEILRTPQSSSHAVFYEILRGAEDTASLAQNVVLANNARGYVAQGIQSNGSWTRSEGKREHTLRFGARVHHDTVLRDHTLSQFQMLSGSLQDTGTAAAETDDKSTAAALSTHAKYILDWDAFILAPGIRSESVWTRRLNFLNGQEIKRFEQQFVPSISALYALEQGINFYSGIHRGFSPVTPGQSPNVLPESSISYEAGMRYEANRSYIDATGFFSDYRNLTSECSNSTGCDSSQLGLQFNEGKVWVYGLELLASQSIALAGSAALDLEVNYTLTQSNFRHAYTSRTFGVVQEGDQIPYVPMHQGSAKVRVAHGIWSASLSAHFKSKMREIAGQGPIPDALHIPSILTLNAHIQVEATQYLKLYLTGQNLTNTAEVISLRPFGARPNHPLQVMGGIKFDL